MNLANKIQYRCTALESLAERHSEFYVPIEKNQLYAGTSLTKNGLLKFVRSEFSDEDYKNDDDLLYDIGEFRLFERHEDPYIHRVVILSLLSKPGIFVLVKDEGSFSICKERFMEDELYIHLRIKDFNDTDE